jgi:hypothetical protein
MFLVIIASSRLSRAYYLHFHGTSKQMERTLLSKREAQNTWNFTSASFIRLLVSVIGHRRNFALALYLSGT